MQKEEHYILIIFSENNIHLLSRILMVFTRRNIKIESIHVKKNDITNIYHYTIDFKTQAALITKIIAQVEKIVEVLRVFAYSDEQLMQCAVAHENGLHERTGFYN